MPNKPASTPKSTPNPFKLRLLKRRVVEFFKYYIWRPFNFIIWRPFKRLFWKPFTHLVEATLNVIEWILQIPVGFISVFLIKPARVDILVAAYILFGKSRVEFLSATLGILGIAVGLLENSLPGLVLAIAGLIGFSIILYILSEAPTIRWHFLSHSISIEYKDRQTLLYKEELTARSLKFNNDELEFSFDFEGEIYIEQIEIAINSQDRNEIHPGGRYILGCYFLEKPEGLGKNKIFVKPGRLLKFAEEVQVSIELRIEDAKESQQRYTVRTLVDELSFKLIFPADGSLKKLENVRVEPFEEFGVGEDSKKRKRNFVRSIRKQRHSNQFCISYKIRYPKYLHKYGIDWFTD